MTGLALQLHMDLDASLLALLSYSADAGPTGAAPAHHNKGPDWRMLAQWRSGNFESPH